MIQFPILNQENPSYSINSYISRSQFGGRDIRALLDRIAQDQHTEGKDIKTLLDRVAEKNQHSFNLMKIVSVILIVAVIINRSGCLIENGKLNTTEPVLSVINPPIVAVPALAPISISTSIPTMAPDPTIIPPPVITSIPVPLTPKLIKTPIPCTYTASPYNVDIEGDCSRDQIRAAFDEKEKLFAQREIDLEAKGRRMADESSKETQIILDRLETERQESILKLDKMTQKYYPSPEEVEAKSLKTKREIDCQMDAILTGWPLYTPVCVKNEIELLGAKLSDNCTTIKKLYKKQSLLYHPDKNSSINAPDKFIAINAAYIKICP